MSNVKDKLLTQEREAVLLTGTDNVGIPFISQTISTPVLYKM